METDERLLVIVDNEEQTYFKNGVLHLAFGVNLYGGIYSLGSYIIFLTHDDILLYYNIDTGELGTAEILKDDTGRGTIVVNNITYPVNHDNYYPSIGNNKLFGKNTIFDYLTIEGKTSNLNIFGSFKYNGNDYYIHTSNLDNMYNNLSKVFNIDVDVDKITNDLLVEGHPEYITIGTEEHKVKVSLPLIYKNSQYMRNLLDIKNINTYEFINKNYDNIELYIHYLERGDQNVNNLSDLYKIVSLMDDINMEYLTFTILTRVKNSNIDINVAWGILKAFYDDNVLKKFEILLYIIYKKYDRADFMKKIVDVNNMNNEILMNIVKSRFVE